MYLSIMVTKQKDANYDQAVLKYCKSVVIIKPSTLYKCNAELYLILICDRYEHQTKKRNVHPLWTDIVQITLIRIDMISL